MLNDFRATSLLWTHKTSPIQIFVFTIIHVTIYLVVFMFETGIHEVFTMVMIVLGCVCKVPWSQALP